jgi:putative ABC transport system permease protein
MIQVTLRGLIARKPRLALTSLAIVLGVAMVSGTFILTDTVGAGVHHIIGGATARRPDATRVSERPQQGTEDAAAAIFRARRPTTGGDP